MASTANPTPTPTPNFNDLDYDFDAPMDFELSDILNLEDENGFQEDSSSSWSMNSSDKVVEGTSPPSSVATSSLKIEMKREGEPGRKKSEGAQQSIGFRTKSKIDVMDDGYKWRKYGKKKVKDTPYPRNYYYCSNEGCKIKKRIERDREHPDYVITTYDGRHNHEIPSVVYCYTDDMSLMSQANWSLLSSFPNGSSER